MREVVEDAIIYLLQGANLPRDKAIKVLESCLRYLKRGGDYVRWGDD